MTQILKSRNGDIYEKNDNSDQENDYFYQKNDTFNLEMIK